MENNINNLKREPLELERKFKLKVFSILAAHKTFKEALPSEKKNFAVATVIAYTETDAVVAAIQGLRNLGVDPKDYIVPASITSTEIEKFIKIPDGKVIVPSVPQPQIIKVQKSNQDMISYIRLVFDQVGTETEKKVAEKVIKKFEEKNG